MLLREDRCQLISIMLPELVSTSVEVRTQSAWRFSTAHRPPPLHHLPPTQNEGNLAHNNKAHHCTPSSTGWREREEPTTNCISRQGSPFSHPIRNSKKIMVYSCFEMHHQMPPLLGWRCCCRHRRQWWKMTIACKASNTNICVAPILHQSHSAHCVIYFALLKKGID